LKKKFSDQNECDAESKLSVCVRNIDRKLKEKMYWEVLSNKEKNKCV
jgi:hypothetical protein